MRVILNQPKKKDVRGSVTIVDKVRFRLEEV